MRALPYDAYFYCPLHVIGQRCVVRCDDAPPRALLIPCPVHAGVSRSEGNSAAVKADVEPTHAGLIDLGFRAGLYPKVQNS